MNVLSEEISHSATSYTQISICNVSVRLGLAVASQNKAKIPLKTVNNSRDGENRET